MDLNRDVQRHSSASLEVVLINKFDEYYLVNKLVFALFIDKPMRPHCQQAVSVCHFLILQKMHFFYAVVNWKKCSTVGCQFSMAELTFDTLFEIRLTQHVIRDEISSIY